MERRALLRNLLSTVVIGVVDTKIIANALVEPDDESYMRRAIRLAGNNPKYPFAAMLVDEEKRVVGEGWNRSVDNYTGPIGTGTPRQVQLPFNL